MSFAIRNILFLFALELLCLQVWAADESQEKAVSFTGTEWHLAKVIFDGAVSGLNMVPTRRLFASINPVYRAAG